MRLERLVAAGVALLSTALAQRGTPARQKPSDYPVHAVAGDLTIAAEYLVRSVPGPKHAVTVSDYLVVEVACFPAKGTAPAIPASRFTLRMNGKKAVLFAQDPGMVAASLKYADWERRPTLIGSVGMGDADVIIGRPRQTERFPNDPRPGRERLPAPPRVPQKEPDLESEPELKPEEIVTDAAFPERPLNGPASGVLYFAYRGKTKSIKSLELLYSEGDRRTVLRLF